MMVYNFVNIEFREWRRGILLVLTSSVEGRKVFPELEKWIKENHFYSLKLEHALISL